MNSVIQSNPDLNTTAWNIFLAHNQSVKVKKKYLSFVDATNIAICREYQISTILAVDGDFDGYLAKL